SETEIVCLCNVYLHSVETKSNRSLPRSYRLNFYRERLSTIAETSQYSTPHILRHFTSQQIITEHTLFDTRKTTKNELIKVLDKIWFGKDVKYDHLQVFGCKAFMHIPKDERPKLDMKTRECIFIGYGHDDYGYRMYDPVEKKLVRSHDVQFLEDQIVEDIDKVKKSTPEKDNNLSKIDPVWMPINDMDTTDNNVQNGEQHNCSDLQLGDGFDFPVDDDVEEEQEMSQDENLGDAPKPPSIQLRRSNMERQSSIRYTSSEYVTLTDGEEPKCYQEAIESEEKQKWMDAMQDVVLGRCMQLGDPSSSYLLPGIL
ncbi:hypothetical protein CR513_12058, partial [Mucuna pruriens]